MEMADVGVDVSKDRLDVHVLPEGGAFAVARDGKGLAELVERMGRLGPERIAVEATGGFETVVAAALAGPPARSSPNCPNSERSPRSPASPASGRVRP